MSNSPFSLVKTTQNSSNVSLPCEANPDLFFPPDLVGDGHDPDERAQFAEEQAWYHGPEAEEAKALCDTCPMRLDCLLRHLAEPHGIFGGMTPEERRLERRYRRVV